MTHLRAIASAIVVAVGFVLFLFWLAFWQIPRNIVGELRSYK